MRKLIRSFITWLDQVSLEDFTSICLVIFSLVLVVTIYFKLKTS